MVSKTKSGLVTDYLEHVSGLMFEEPYRAEVARLIRGHAGSTRSTSETSCITWDWRRI